MVVLPSSSGRPGPTPGAAGGQLTDCPATAFSSSAGGEETRPNPILAAGTKSRTHRLESILTNSCGAKAWATARCSVVVKKSTSPPDSLSVRAVTSSPARQLQCLRSRPSADERLIPARPSAPTKPNLLKRPGHARERCPRDRWARGHVKSVPVTCDGVPVRRPRGQSPHDPWQAIGLAQRLRMRGVAVTEWTVSPVSIGRLAMTLHLLLREHRLALRAAADAMPRGLRAILVPGSGNDPQRVR